MARVIASLVGVLHLAAREIGYPFVLYCTRMAVEIRVTVW